MSKDIEVEVTGLNRGSRSAMERFRLETKQRALVQQEDE
jgi:hypothetical protein